MDKKETALIVKRIDRFFERLGKSIITDSTLLKAKFRHCQEPVVFDKRLEADFSEISEGEVWGCKWESGWFELEGVVPSQWKGSKVVGWLDFGGEGLVFNSDGVALQGISNGSVFQHDFNRDIVPLFKKCDGGEVVHLWVETAANGLFGMFTEPDPVEESPNRYGHYDAKINKMRLAVFDNERWHLWLDVRILRGLIMRLPEKSVRRAKIIKIVNEMIDYLALENSEIKIARQMLEKEMNQPANASALTVTAIGHAHIDTAWLWPVSESVRKCARTFSSQLSLIEKYPDYIFGASQPQHYQFVKDNYPEIYERIKKAVKKGQWEVQGAMWVEADSNLISGESMVRQILYGKNFFKDEFGVDVKNLWLPDVFGYSAALPQLLKKSGVDYFLTQKMSWNQFNDFPYHTFIWRGIDNSEVVTHFPPENNYNSQLDTEYLIPAEEHYYEKEKVDEFISLFGVGDGGGGPKEENIQFGMRLADLEGAPKVKFGSAAGFFEEINKYKQKLDCWVGELYLELHRGTLTTQAFVKKANRKLEFELRAIEMLAAMLPPSEYPQDKIEKVWKIVLINQFHDILPGSSITKVYTKTKIEYKTAFEKCGQLFEELAGKLFDKNKHSMILFNSLSLPYRGTIELLVEKENSIALYDKNNIKLEQQQEGEKLIAEVEIAPLSMKILNKIEENIPEAKESKLLVLENELIRYSFDSHGRIFSIFDKEVEKEIIADKLYGNLLTLYDDRPNDWDAWDIDKFYEKAVVSKLEACCFGLQSRGAVRSTLEFEYQFNKSIIKQKVILNNNSKRLDIETEVDWYESHKMLRVSFPVNIYTDQAIFDIQYGYVKRPTHRNNSWDRARFEVVGHKYADLSDNNYGVALLNDCKYGYKVHDNILDLNLLRSPKYPDPDADMGKHSFTYSLLPHTGGLINSKVIIEAEWLNQPVKVFDGYTTTIELLPWQFKSDSIQLEVVKKAEKEDCLIVRLVERKGLNASGELCFDKLVKLSEIDLMEWKSLGEIDQADIYNIKMKPFEIKTFKVVSR